MWAVFFPSFTFLNYWFIFWQKAKTSKNRQKTGLALKRRDKESFLKIFFLRFRIRGSNMVRKLFHFFEKVTWQNCQSFKNLHDIPYCHGKFLTYSKKQVQHITKWGMGSTLHNFLLKFDILHMLHIWCLFTCQQPACSTRNIN